ncbi:MAG: malonyl-ACP O-methyltransferase BioC [Mariprofundaceae bacterium]|nr:malonyl-ACP O-methyltransferase BioC [Mariprofundaceae bacterium]
MSEYHINSWRVSQQFSQAVDTYDAHAVLQREVAERLIAHTEFTRLKPARILDIGCGTGYFTGLLRNRFKRAHIVALDIASAMTEAAKKKYARRLPWQAKTQFATADALSLPFPDTAFDLVCSNLTLQWVTQPRQMLAEMRRVLAPDGLMLLSTFGRRTLSELRQSLASIKYEHAGLVLPFPDVTSLGNCLMELPVELPVTDTDLFTLTYPDGMALVRELKALGASASAISNRPGGLYGRSLLRQLDTAYNTAYQTEDGRIRATFEILYAQAWYAEAPHTYDKVIPIYHGD